MKLSRSLDRLATVQQGLLSTAQLRAEITSAQIETAVQIGALIPVRRSVYRTAGSGPSWLQTVLAVQLACPSLVVSHRSAARLWGLTGSTFDIIEVTSPQPCRMKGATVHWTQVVEAPVLVDGVGVTSVARTLCDIASVLPPLALRRRVDDALDRRLVHIDELSQAFDQLGTGRRGLVALAKVIEERYGDRTESVTEREVLSWLQGTRLPAPVSQYSVWSSSGDEYRLDFAWPSQKVAVEAAGYAYHGDRKAFDSDSRRYSKLAAEGWKLFVVTVKTAKDDFLGDLVRVLRPLRDSA